MTVNCRDYYFLMEAPSISCSLLLPPSLPSLQFSCLVNGTRASSQACTAKPPLRSLPPIQTASCSAVPLTAGSSQVRCSTQPTTCSLLTAVYHACLSHRRRCEDKVLVDAVLGLERDSLEQLLCQIFSPVKPQTNEARLILGSTYFLNDYTAL